MMKHLVGVYPIESPRSCTIHCAREEKMSCQSLRRSSSRPARVGDSLRGRRACIASDDDGSTVTSKLIPLTMSSEQHSHSPPSRAACTLRSFPSGLQAPVLLTLRACTHARRNTVNAVAVARGMVRETGGWKGHAPRGETATARASDWRHHAEVPRNDDCDWKTLTRCALFANRRRRW